ncbi:DUF3820 family protein [Acidithiobacillus sp. MC6.1]|nr:DUF3820 family protein [Acidithiobacillus sp. MC6.1]
MSILIFDTETTSLNEPDLIEAAWLSLDPADLTGKTVIPEPFSQRYKPSKPISLGAMATHHILDEDLSDCPPSSDFALPEAAILLIGHNIDFDWRVIGEPKIRRVCTLAMARKVFPGLDSYSQSALLYYFYPNQRPAIRERLRAAHSALADVRFCQIILRQIIRRAFPDGLSSWKALWEFSEQARIPETMPFGKHRGVKMAELPADYRKWALEKMPDLDPYLRKALEAAA